MLKLDHTVKTYQRNDIAWFRRTAEENGEGSNMCKGFPIHLNGLSFDRSEMLYQALKFSHDPEIQRELSHYTNPMKVKFRAKKIINTGEAAFDKGVWAMQQDTVMMYTVMLKLIFNWIKFGSLFEKNPTKPFVEVSRKDKYWGANPQPTKSTEEDKTIEHWNVAVGTNALGQVLDRAREYYFKYAGNPEARVVPTGDILSKIRLNGEKLPTVTLAQTMKFQKH